MANATHVKARTFSMLPKTQRPIVAALLDGIEVYAEYVGYSGARGGTVGYWLVGTRSDARRFDRYAAKAVLDLETKGIAQRGNTIVTLIPGAVIDDRAES